MHLSILMGWKRGSEALCFLGCHFVCAYVNVYVCMPRWRLSLTGFSLSCSLFLFVVYVIYVCQAKTGPAAWKWIRENAGKPHDEHVVQKAAEEVEEFCRVLTLEGVTVRRPEPMRWDQLGTFRTPYFEDGGQVCCNVHDIAGIYHFIHAVLYSVIQEVYLWWRYQYQALKVSHSGYALVRHF